MNVLAAIVCFIFGGCIGAFIMALFKSSALASEREEAFSEKERAEHAIKKANEYKDKYEKLENKYKKEKQKDK